jgi:Flp pilus assembly protein TadG
MSIWRKKLRSQSKTSGEEGQSLLETAIGIPLLLGIAFNTINIGYLWFTLLSLSAAPRQGVEYSTQGGAAGTSSTAPGTTAVSNLVYDNLTKAIKGATTSNAGVRVCTNALGVAGTGSSQVSLCQSFGPSMSVSAVAADPEAPTFVLNRVDVVYTITPIIPGSAFMVVLPANLQFHRQVSMRSLY